MINFLYKIYIRSPFYIKKILAKLFVFIKPFLKVFVRRKHVGGYYMYLDSSDNASFAFYSIAERQDQHLINLFLSFISYNPRSYFVDVGASYGLYTLAIADVGRFGLLENIFAFEPDTRSFAALSKSVENSKFKDIVEVSNVLVGNKKGKAKLFKSKTSSVSNRSFSSSSETLMFSDIVELDSIILDDFIGSRVSIEDTIFFIKIDVEGSDFRVLQGMQDIFEKSKGFLVQFEYYPLGIIEVGLNLKEHADFIAKLEIDFAFSSRSSKGLEFLGNKEALLDLIDGFNRDPQPSVAANLIIGKNLAIPPVYQKNE